MPDADGNFKGMSVPADAWERIFLPKTVTSAASRVRWSLPNKAAAVEAGCTCEWFGRGAIIRFDQDCPVLDRHHIPDGPQNWKRRAG